MSHTEIVGRARLARDDEAADFVVDLAEIRRDLISCEVSVAMTPPRDPKGAVWLQRYGSEEAMQGFPTVFSLSDDTWTSVGVCHPKSTSTLVGRPGEEVFLQALGSGGRLRGWATHRLARDKTVIWRRPPTIHAAP